MNYIKLAFNYLYKNWQYMTLPIAAYMLVLLLCNLHSMSWIVFLIWLQVPIYMIHQFEEHAFPGGFKDFVNRNLFHITRQDVPLDDTNVFWINIPFIGILFPFGAAFAQLIDPSIGMLVVFFAMFNATLHILWLIAFRKYNPGVLASIFLNYPSGIYTLIVAHQLGILTWQWSLVAFSVALIGHLCIVVYAVWRYQHIKREGKLLIT